jgi:hypothetical protein
MARNETKVRRRADVVKRRNGSSVPRTGDIPLEPEAASCVRPEFVLPNVEPVAHLARQAEKNPFADDLGLRARLVQSEDGQYSEEFILHAVHQMSLAKIPCDQMARRFGVSIRTVMRWRAALKDKFREEARLFDPVAFLGRSLKHYEALTAAAWQLHMTGRTHSDKLRALEVARSVEGDVHKFLHVAGFYDAVQFQPTDASSKDEAVRHADDLRVTAQQFLAELAELGEAESLPED